MIKNILMVISIILSFGSISNASVSTSCRISSEFKLLFWEGKPYSYSGLTYRVGYDMTQMRLVSFLVFSNVVDDLTNQSLPDRHITLSHGSLKVRGRYGIYNNPASVAQSRFKREIEACAKGYSSSFTGKIYEDLFLELARRHRL